MTDRERILKVAEAAEGDPQFVVRRHEDSVHIQFAEFHRGDVATLDATGLAFNSSALAKAEEILGLTPRLPLVNNRHILINARRVFGASFRGRPHWAFVKELTGTGQTTARRICEELGWDADRNCHAG